MYASKNIAIALFWLGTAAHAQTVGELSEMARSKKAEELRPAVAPLPVPVVQPGMAIVPPMQGTMRAGDASVTFGPSGPAAALPNAKPAPPPKPEILGIFRVGSRYTVELNDGGKQGAYSVGATIPSGWRIVHVDLQRVELEKSAGKKRKPRRMTLRIGA